MNLSNAAVKTCENWQAVCQAQDLVADSGVVVWLDGAQVALFYLPGQPQPLYAVDNRDPRSGANIIGRGLVGSVQGELVVAAPPSSPIDWRCARWLASAVVMKSLPNCNWVLIPNSD